jgi:hypothetical protein
VPVSVVNLKFAVLAPALRPWYLLPLGIAFYMSPPMKPPASVLSELEPYECANKTIGRRASELGKVRVVDSESTGGNDMKTSSLIAVASCAGLAIALGDTALVKLLAPSPSDTPLIAAATRNKLRRSVRDPGGSS